MATRTYAVSLDDGARSRLPELLRHLRDAGLEVTQQLDAVGVIVGRADDANLSRLRAVPGVAAIDEERVVRSLPDTRRD